jgi:hypothetical protein
MEGRPRFERYCIRTYEDDPTDHGFMTRHRDKSEAVERNDRNDHFFVWNAQDGQFELIYHGSAEIAGMMELHREQGRQSGFSKRPLSFFDIGGHFYDSVTLHSLKDVTPDSALRHNHSAIFQTADGELFPIAVDAIYCLGLSKPEAPHPGNEPMLPAYPEAT